MGISVSDFDFGRCDGRHNTSIVQKIALTARWLWPRNCDRGPTAKPPCIAFARRWLRPKSPRRGDDRVSGTDADRHENISHNGSSGFGGNADSAETADLRPCDFTPTGWLSRPR